jgi:EAL domain-containing protein (putative c-di-GMP-specific phosphodiesterase class I)
VRAVVAMSHAIGLEVVAEGVETPVQRELLRELGCDMVQGYLFGRPRSASATLSEHDRWLAGLV